MLPNPFFVKINASLFPRKTVPFRNKKKLSKVNNRPIVENSPNLVTLDPANWDGRNVETGF
jgi:hypothetical protein